MSTYTHLNGDYDSDLAPSKVNLAQLFYRFSIMSLSSSQKKQFRTIGHNLSPVVSVASKGLSKSVMDEINRALNDHELEDVLDHAAQAGCRHAGYVVLRLPREVNPLFKDWLSAHYPLRFDHVMNRIRDLRAGRESDAEFGRRMHGQGVFASLIRQRFARKCRELNLNSSRVALNASSFKRPQEDDRQLDLF